MGCPKTQTKRNKINFLNVGNCSGRFTKNIDD